MVRIPSDSEKWRSIPSGWNQRLSVQSTKVLCGWRKCPFPLKFSCWPKTYFEVSPEKWADGKGRILPVRMCRSSNSRRRWRCRVRPGPRWSSATTANSTSGLPYKCKSTYKREKLTKFWWLSKGHSSGLVFWRNFSGSVWPDLSCYLGGSPFSVAECLSSGRCSWSGRVRNWIVLHNANKYNTRRTKSMLTRFSTCHRKYVNTAGIVKVTKLWCGTSFDNQYWTKQTKCSNGCLNKPAETIMKQVRTSKLVAVAWIMLW